MKQGLLILLTVCVLALAMVPRDKRDVEEQRICAAHTPCSWNVYNPETKIVFENLINNYCTCGNGTTCQFYEDDTSGNMHVYRCQKPEDEDTSS